MVIAHMGKGHFTNGGHYIVLSAINQEGKVYVHDPNNRGNKDEKMKFIEKEYNRLKEARKNEIV